MSRTFGAILAGYLILAALYALWIPLWEAPDEPAHFLYVHHIAETGSPPPPPPPQRGRFFEHGFVVSAYEWHQMPLYYGLAVPLLVLNRTLEGLPVFAGFPPINPDFPLAVRLFLPPPTGVTEMHLLRLFSVFLGGCTLVVIGWTARLLAPQQAYLPELAAGLVAFIPQFTFLHAYITNDALAVLAAALGLATLVQVVLAAPAQMRRAWMGAGLVASAALATKMTAWFVVPLAGWVWFALWLQGKRTGRAAAGDLLVYSVSLLVLPLAVWLLWPDLVDRLAHSPQAGSIRPEYMNFAYLWSLLPQTHASFWGFFGWMNVPMLPLLHRLFDVVWLVGVAGAGIGWLRMRPQGGPALRLAAFLLTLAALAVLLQFFAFNLTVTQPQGRFLYPGVMGAALLSAWGWLFWAGRRRGFVTVGLLSVLALVNLWNLLFILRPAYE